MQNPIGLKQGLRTPFVKKDAQFAKLNPVELSRILADTLLARADFSPRLIQHVVWGMVVPDPDIYSIAREMVLASSLDNQVEAYSVSRACATSLQAATNAVLYYHAFPQEKSLSLTGGVESFSSVRPVLTHAASDYFKGLAQKGSPLEKLARILAMPGAKMFPVPPSAKEYSTGLTMGQHCELMIQEFKVSRARQDAFALASHLNAAKARPHIAPQIITVNGINKDTLIREDTSPEKLASLKPAFDREKGSVTAGNASPFTDGAAGLYVISPAAEKEVKADAHLIDFEYVGINPVDGLLMGPGKAILKILERRQLKWKDLDYIDMHEAFAGQVLCNVDAVNSAEYRAGKYGVNYDAGLLDEKILNPWGSSISYGHPFGATGARMLSQAIAYLKHSGKKLAAVGACTAGGLAGACLIRNNG